MRRTNQRNVFAISTFADRKLAARAFVVSLLVSIPSLLFSQPKRLLHHTERELTSLLSTNGRTFHEEGTGHAKTIVVTQYPVGGLDGGLRVAFRNDRSVAAEWKASGGSGRELHRAFHRTCRALCAAYGKSICKLDDRHLSEIAFYAYRDGDEVIEVAFSHRNELTISWQPAAVWDETGCWADTLRIPVRRAGSIHTHGVR